jgi:hypothetical protein
MLRISCDNCGKDLQPSVDPHYIVKIEVFAAHDTNKICEADLDEDCLEKVSEILTHEELTGPEPAEEPAYKRIRFDLCSSCHKKYLQNPLSNESSLHSLDFSDN